MKTVKTLIFPALLLTSFFVNAAAVVDAKPMGKPDSSGVAQQRPLDQLKQQLSLTEDQVKAIEQIQQENQKKAIEDRKMIIEGDFKVFFALAPDSKEYAEITKKMADTAANRARNKMLNMAESRKKVYAILNAEQKKKFLEISKPMPRQAINPQRKGEKPAVE